MAKRKIFLLNTKATEVPLLIQQQKEVKVRKRSTKAYYKKGLFNQKRFIFILYDDSVLSFLYFTWRIHAK
jgi:hypothetical protein